MMTSPEVAMRLAVVLTVAVSLARASTAWSQARGPEFRVNSFTSGYQGRPRIATASDGSFVVVWESSFGAVGQDGSQLGVFGQRYDKSGMPLGTEFRVNTFTTLDQYQPSVASDSAGNFIIIWVSVQPYPFREVYGQRYDSAGASLGVEFRISTTQARYPSIVCSASGDFLVVWGSGGTSNDGNLPGIFGQRWSSTGAPLGVEFRINTYTTNLQTTPAVASDSAGNFVVAWQSVGQDGSKYQYGIFAQRFGSTGAPLGAEFRVNTTTASSQKFAALASDSVGNFVVVWQSPDQDNYGVFGQRYASSGSPLGAAF